jgi:hemerythrin-like domain-containing protein
VDPIETLMTEHRLIERTLDALESFAAGLARGAPATRDDLGRFARFFAEFADAHHHGKEENLLFAAMVDAGFPKEGGPIAVMLHEHDLGRACVAVLRRVAGGAGELSADERARAAEAAGSYAAMLRSHIRKEDRILYPMAEGHLPPEAMTALAAAFDRYEGERGAAADGLVALAEELAVRHPASSAEEPASSRKLDTRIGHGGCGGSGSGCGGHH